VVARGRWRERSRLSEGGKERYLVVCCIGELLAAGVVFLRERSNGLPGAVAPSLKRVESSQERICRARGVEANGRPAADKEKERLSACDAGLVERCACGLWDERWKTVGHGLQGVLEQGKDSGVSWLHSAW
jgi:hypothetical protein